MCIATFGNVCGIGSELLIHCLPPRCDYYLDDPGMSSSSFEEEGMVTIVSPLDAPG